MSLSTPSESSDVARIGHPRSNNIEICINNHFASKIYNTSSPVNGAVTITPRRSARFDSLQIILLGITRTRSEGIHTSRDVAHTFLKMAMPIDESAYPVPRVFQPGRSYRFPFEFVIPSHLTVNACNHTVQNPNIIDHHTLPPPTTGGGSWGNDDMTPEMVRVQYFVKARLFRQDDLSGPPAKIMDASKEIRVLPMSVEEPPMTVSRGDRLYTMSTCKTLRKGFLSGKIGRLTAAAIQPTAVILRPDARAASGIAAQVQLTFNPASADVLPPKVANVTAKVVAHTFYSGAAITTLPHLGDWVRAMSGSPHGYYSTSVSLPPTPPPRARWNQHLSSAVRRDSGYSSESPDDEPENEGGKTAKPRSAAAAAAAETASPVFHTTTLRLPLELPTDRKTFVPTFHACTASRTYTLQLAVTVGSGSAAATVPLSVPLQVAVEAAPVAEPDAVDPPSFEEAEAEAYMRSRVVRAPEAQYTATSVLPGYGDWAVGR